MKQKPEIWVVDQDGDTLTLMEHAFQAERLTCRVVAFDNETSLYQHIKSSSSLPAMLMVEYSVSLLNGLTTVQHLRAHPLTKTIKLVLFGSSLTADMLNKAQELGIYQIERKPLDFQQWRNFAKELCLAGHFT